MTQCILYEKNYKDWFDFKNSANKKLNPQRKLEANDRGITEPSQVSNWISFTIKIIFNLP